MSDSTAEINVERIQKIVLKEKNTIKKLSNLLITTIYNSNHMKTGKDCEKNYTYSYHNQQSTFLSLKNYLNK